LRLMTLGCESWSVLLPTLSGQLNANAPLRNSFRRLWVRHTSFHSPLHVLKATEQELPEAGAVFDLTERRFDDRFPPGILRLALLRPQLAGHLLFRREVFRRTTFWEPVRLVRMARGACRPEETKIAVVMFPAGANVFVAKLWWAG
jgi:hypothetical protein